MTVQFDLKEKDVLIASLLSKVAVLQGQIKMNENKMQTNNNNSNSSNSINMDGKKSEAIVNANNTSIEEHIVLTKKIEKYEEDLKNVRTDVDRLQVRNYYTVTTTVTGMIIMLL